jgi:hypothetical protein
MSRLNLTPEVPRISAQGCEQGEPRGQRGRGSNRGRRLAGNVPKYRSLGVLPPSHVCGLDSLYQATICVNS